MFREVYIEKQKHFDVDLSVKYTPTEGSNKLQAQGNIKFHYNKNSSLTSILRSFTERVSLIKPKRLIQLHYKKQTWRSVTNGAVLIFQVP